ncbi:hypothetical protein UY3_00364 [Chelonia mydas]|uniref:Uncharacterized protein n=1 Tax=Chelonia mydas TaxID=8469 RepID=M7CCD9_CHEMY|nr:hypothetical protein UY3_00364 [Chelonia mydas]
MIVTSKSQSKEGNGVKQYRRHLLLLATEAGPLLRYSSRTVPGTEEAIGTDTGTGKTAGSSEALGPDAAHGTEALFTQILGTEKATRTFANAE